MIIISLATVCNYKSLCSYLDTIQVRDSLSRQVTFMKQTSHACWLEFYSGREGLMVLVLVPQLAALCPQKMQGTDARDIYNFPCFFNSDGLPSSGE